jgi:uncharacterized DUF497 family protein
MESEGFDWDPAKNVSNLRKHGISSEDAAAIFDTPDWVEWICSEPGDEEERYMIVGRLGWKIVSAVYTERGDTIRLISAREANRYERRQFREGKARL